ncbi:MAG TPA: hypothetical protein VIZ30_04085 [Pseudomonadales bacterium]
MYSVLFGVIVLAVVAGLFVWARRRAEGIRQSAAQREQAALAAMLATGKNSEPAEAAIDIEAAIRAAHARVEAKNHVTPPVAEPRDKELPPIEYERNGTRASRELTPAEDAASGLDPIEDLISQIMVDDSGKRSVNARPAAPPRPVAPRRASPPTREPTPMLDSMAPSVPLRELVLAWYESRGYRGVPASPAVWPIELVLRHRDDASRAYAFVVQTDNVSVDRITALIEQAREIGMMRVAIIAEAGYERGAKEIARRRSVRLIDRATMDAELADLQLETAAKIIAVARKRATPEASAA